MPVLGDWSSKMDAGVRRWAGSTAANKTQTGARLAVGGEPGAGMRLVPPWLVRWSALLYVGPNVPLGHFSAD